MITFGQDAYDAFSEKGYKTEPLVNELKEKLKSGNLTKSERGELIKRIATMEHAGKSKQKELSMQLLAVDTTNYVGGLFGPIGSGATTLLTDNIEKDIRSAKKLRIQKAQIRGGKRGVKAKGKGRVGWMPSTESVVAAAKVSLTVLATDLLSPFLTDPLSRSWSYIKSYF